MDTLHYNVLTDTSFSLLESFTDNYINNRLISSEDGLSEYLMEASDAKTEKLAYKEARKNAVDAVILSRERHLIQRELKEHPDDDKDIPLYRAAVRKLSAEKFNKLADMVDAADKTNDHVSVDIHDDKGFRSVTADFDKEDTHMSLHAALNLSRPILLKDRKGRKQSTGYGENNRFIKIMTGKDLPELVSKKYAKDMKTLGLKPKILRESITVSVSSKDLKNIFNLPISRLTNYTDAEIRREILDKGGDIKKDVNKYRIPNSDKHLTLNQMRNYILANGDADTKDTMKDRYEAVENAINKAIDKDVAYDISFNMVNGIYRLYKKAKKRSVKHLKESIDSSILDNIFLESEFSDDLNAIYGKLENPKYTSLTIAAENNSPVTDVIKSLDGVIYGFINKKTGERVIDREFIHSCDNLHDIYDVNWNPEKTLNDKLGICTDQSVATRYLLNKYHPNIEVQLYALYKGRFGHCVCTYKLDNKYYYLEHAWDKEEGLHGPFDSEGQLEEYLSCIYHKHHDKDNDDPVIVKKYNPGQLK